MTDVKTYFRFSNFCKFSPPNPSKKIMLHLKFFILLRTLKKEELESFHQYLKQLYGNERIALSLFAYIRKFHPDFSDEKRLNMEYAYRKVFGVGIGKNRKQVLNTLSDLHGWLKAFLMSEKITKDSFENGFLWLTILQERGLQVEFSRQASRIRREVNAMPKTNTLDYLKEVRVNHFIHYHLPMDKFPSTENGDACLDLFYALTKFKLACEKANCRNIQHEETEPASPLPVLDNFPSLIQAQEPLFLLYREVYQLLATHRKESFDALETILPKYGDAIATFELNTILRYLHNYATSQIRKGNEEYWKRIHHLNKFSLERGMFSREGVMSGAQFNNIVSAACNAKETAWASDFVVSKSIFLQNDIRHEAIPLAEATILFEKQDFENVLTTLAGKDFKDFLNIIRSKALTLRSLYELRAEDDMIWDFCSNFEAFLRRHRTPRREAVEATLQFIRIFKILLRKKSGKDQILSDINSTEMLYFKSWLSDKTTDYKNEFAAPKRKK